jgi:hypothetical protein
MTVEILRLTGLAPGEARQAADRLVDHRTGPPRIERLLVVDDTARLVEHGPVYEHIVSSRRVYDFLCLAVGPRPGDGRALPLPRNGNLAGTQGTGVLWVGDPDGIDWRAAVAAIANGHAGGKASGVDVLIHLLTIDGVFTRVRQTFEGGVQGGVPGRVASAGLKLAGEEDEAAVFAAALAVAIRAVTEGGAGAGGPFPALLPSVAGGAALEAGGPLARYRDEVTDYVEAASGELAKMSGITGVLRGADGFRRDVAGARDALAYLRDLVARLLRDASATGELTRNQRQLLLAAGLRFPAEPQGAAGAERPAEQSAAYRAIGDAIQGGDPLELVSKRLALTEHEVKRRGSAAYLPEVESRCPAGLLDRLAASAHHPPRRASAQARQELGLDDALRAARALTDLVVMVANREWSPATASAVELSRVRIAIDGGRRELVEHAVAAGESGAGARGARLGRLSEALIPVLRDLARTVVADESRSPSPSGRDAFDTARTRTAGRLAEWTRHVEEHGVSAAPPFASASVTDVPLVVEQDVAEVREALSYPVADEMWQLCGPADLGALDAAVPPLAIRFASRLAKDALAGKPFAEDPVWTSTGSFAGVLRLVPLRPGVVAYKAAEPAASGGSPVTEPSG